MNARIIVMECTDLSWFDRLTLGAWYWQASIPGKGRRSGNARTETRAREKAGHAARKLATKPTGKFEQYNLPLDD